MRGLLRRKCQAIKAGIRYQAGKLVLFAEQEDFADRAFVSMRAIAVLIRLGDGDLVMVHLVAVIGRVHNAERLQADKQQKKSQT